MELELENRDLRAKIKELERQLKESRSGDTKPDSGSEIDSKGRRDLQRAFANFERSLN